MHRRTPKYRHFKPKNLGMVVIDGRAHYLGKYNSSESHERYHRLIAEFHAGRQVSASGSSTPDPGSGMTINELILAYGFGRGELSGSWSGAVMAWANQGSPSST